MAELIQIGFANFGYDFLFFLLSLAQPDARASAIFIDELRNRNREGALTSIQPPEWSVLSVFVIAPFGLKASSFNQVYKN
jgi:hypothetical protein